jgi:Na+:H+ antiporter, NhaA family
MRPRQWLRGGRFRIMHVMSQQRNNIELTLPVGERDHVLGPADAPLTLLEYGDYECSYCARSVPVVRRLREEYGERLRFVFRHFPLNSVHPHASQAAQAAEAAAAQGRFWEMHDLLYANQDHLEDMDLLQLALKVGLEIYRFRSDVTSERFVRRVREDLESGQASGVRRTPTFFVNGRRIEERGYDDLKQALEAQSIS